MSDFQALRGFRSCRGDYYYEPLRCRREKVGMQKSLKTMQKPLCLDGFPMIFTFVYRSSEAWMF